MVPEYFREAEVAFEREIAFIKDRLCYLMGIFFLTKLRLKEPC